MFKTISCILAFAGLYNASQTTAREVFLETEQTETQIAGSIRFDGMAGTLFEVGLDQARADRLRVLMAANRLLTSGFSRADNSKDKVVRESHLQNFLVNLCNEQEAGSGLTVDNVTFILSSEWDSEACDATFTKVMTVTTEPLVRVPLTISEAIQMGDRKYRVEYDLWRDENLGLRGTMRALYTDMYNACRPADSYADSRACGVMSTALAGCVTGTCMLSSISMITACITSPCTLSFAFSPTWGECLVNCPGLTLMEGCGCGYLLLASPGIIDFYLFGPTSCAACCIGCTRSLAENVAYSVPVLNTASKVCCFKV